MSDENKDALSGDTYAAAEADAKKDGAAFYTHKFNPVFEWMGKTYDKLEFDFGKLKGSDSLAIEREMNTKGKAVVMPAASVDYLIALSARASGLGADAFESMPLRDFNKIRSKARSFLLSTEL